MYSKGNKGKLVHTNIRLIGTAFKKRKENDVVLHRLAITAIS